MLKGGNNEIEEGKEMMQNGLMAKWARLGVSRSIQSQANVAKKQERNEEKGTSKKREKMEIIGRIIEQT